MTLPKRPHLYPGDIVQYRPEPPLPGTEAVVHTVQPAWVNIGYTTHGICEYGAPLIPRYGPPIQETVIRHGFHFTHLLWVPYHHLTLLRRDWGTLSTRGRHHT